MHRHEQEIEERAKESKQRDQVMERLREELQEAKEQIEKQANEFKHRDEVVERLAKELREENSGQVQVIKQLHKESSGQAQEIKQLRAEQIHSEVKQRDQEVKQRDQEMERLREELQKEGQQRREVVSLDTSKTSPEAECIDPDSSDIPGWKCRCYDELKMACRGKCGGRKKVQTCTECIEMYLCESSRICSSWKMKKGCGSALLLQAHNRIKQSTAFKDVAENALRDRQNAGGEDASARPPLFTNEGAVGNKNIGC